MLESFYVLFINLNDKAKEAIAKDDNDELMLLEHAQEELLDAWTDYMMSMDTCPSEEEMHKYHLAFDVVSKF